jgi:4'-phosphopantetheinyl transferase EntD
MIALAARLAPLGIVLAARTITPGDEAAFADPAEPLGRRRASGAARLAARAALANLGGPADAPLPRSPGRFPLWPAGFVGSLAHDEVLAVAACGRAADVVALGVDVEPAEPLPEDVAAIALFGPERREAEADPVWGRAIFAAKEAVYKAINPLDGTPLEYEDIAVDLSEETGRIDGGPSPPPLRGRVRVGAPTLARLRDGRTLRLDYARGSRWLVVASIPR